MWDYLKKVVAKSSKGAAHLVDDEIISAGEGEIDAVVYQTFFAARAGPGVLVEVGAADPDYLSIGASFRRRGWRVISVEPNPEFARRHRERGHEVLEFACSDRDADDVDFTIVDSGGAVYLGGNVSYESFSSLGITGNYASLLETVADATKVTQIKVGVRKLHTLLAGIAPPVSRVDILAVDVEGWELTVMRGLDLTVYPVRVVILENLFADQEYGKFMAQHGYRLWQEIPPNQVYVRS